MLCRQAAAQDPLAQANWALDVSGDDHPLSTATSSKWREFFRVHIVSILYVSSRCVVMAEARQLAPIILQHAAAALARQLACSKLEQPPTDLPCLAYPRIRLAQAPPVCRCPMAARDIESHAHNIDFCPRP